MHFTRGWSPHLPYKEGFVIYFGIMALEPASAILKRELLILTTGCIGTFLLVQVSWREYPTVIRDNYR